MKDFFFLNVGEKLKPKTVRSIFALDLGSAKFALAHLKSESPDKKMPPITTVDVTELPAAGVKRGVLSDFNQAEGVLLSLLEKAEHEFREDITQVVVGVGGHHLDCFHEVAEVELGNASITAKHVELLLAQIKEKLKRPDKELLQIVPTYYQLDQRKNIQNPIGLSGHYLRGEFLTVWADKAYLTDVIRLCNQCGLQVISAYGEAFAVASVIQHEEAKKLGAAIVDIGAGKFSGLVVYQNLPEKIISSALGAGLLTQDLALAFNLSIEEAERLKVMSGIEAPEHFGSLNISTINGEEKNLNWQEITEILGPRVNEMARHMALNLITHKGRLGGGVLLTGGGSELHGIDSFLQTTLKIPVLRLSPKLVTGHFEKTFSPKHATVVGLIKLEADHQDKVLNKIPASKMGRWTHEVSRWIKELS